MVLDWVWSDVLGHVHKSILVALSISTIVFPPSGMCQAWNKGTGMLQQLATSLFFMLTQPVELLPKSFPQGLDFTGFNLSDAYLEYESQRKEKLHAVRSERVRLKQAEQRLQWQESSTRESSINHCKCDKANDTALPDKVCALFYHKMSCTVPRASVHKLLIHISKFCLRALVYWAGGLPIHGSLAGCSDITNLGF